MLVTKRAVHDYFNRLLEIDPGAKPAIYLQMVRSARVLNVNYALELLLSAGIATFGLVLNSPAVVIGAMLISPLMGPILASGLAFAASDLYLGIKSFLGIVASVVAAVLFSAFLVWLLPFQSPTAEILARTQPNLLDLGVALFSGLAGSIVVCRGGGGGGVTALPGVAIAVALMPPLCTVGFGVGSGWNWPIISGAMLLFLTNLVAIGASAFAVFYLEGMDEAEVREAVAPATRDEAHRGPFARLIEKIHMEPAIGDIGKLRWRVLMVAVTFVLLFIPLRKSLMQLAGESTARAAAREAVRLIGAPNVLTQQLDILTDNTVLRLVVAEAVPAAKVRAAERLMIERTHRPATVIVRKVAGEEELAALRERLRQPMVALPPPPPPSLEDLRKTVIERIRPAVRELWPEGASRLLGYEFGYTEQGAVMRLQYEAPRPLDAAAREAIERGLRSRLGIDPLGFVYEWKRGRAVPAKR
ncbi:MAG: hypothetical protein KatS3mg004_3386 [Bryobacteraceae bacterium]|nr:MAG: hypothetical protein KatS3mg004_3386 [Bryobacteraceae bacterium]